MLAATALLAAACTTRPDVPAHRIRLVADDPAVSTPYIEVSGLSRSEVAALARIRESAGDWQRVLAVRVAGAPADQPSVAGKHLLHDRTIRFIPAFPLDPGRRYDVAFDPGPLGATASASLSATVALPAAAPSPPTFVTQVFPSAEVVPENQLRMYIHFSAPMGRRGGLQHVALLDDREREVEDPFLPLDAEFWNDDRTRYTVFFDPGRQKRGILPNRQLGPSLVAGRRYTLVVRRDWVDGNGNPLRETFTRQFRVGPPDMEPLDPSRWRITAPAEATRDPLIVVFPAPLDHGLLLRAVGVRRDGQPVTGEVRVDERETRWTVTPAAPWARGRYELIALSFLEDLAGNRIGRAFEVDGFDRVDTQTVPEVIATPFNLAAPREHAAAVR